MCTVLSETTFSYLQWFYKFTSVLETVKEKNSIKISYLFSVPHQHFIFLTWDEVVTTYTNPRCAATLPVFWRWGPAMSTRCPSMMSWHDADLASYYAFLVLENVLGWDHLLYGKLCSFNARSLQALQHVLSLLSPCLPLLCPHWLLSTLLPTTKKR